VQISVEQFKEKYSRFIDDVQKYHNEITITKFGRPVAKLVPIVDEVIEKPLFGYMKGSVLIHKDILEPIEEKWEVDE